MPPFAPFIPFGARAAQQAPYLLTPEEEASLLAQVGQKTLGGLAWIGETLDKPGSAVRGLLAGRPEQLLNLIPFSDTLGITDPVKDRTSGRELLEMAGMLGPNKKGLDWGDVGGFAAEVGLDPLAWGTFGASALVKGPGTAAKAAGMICWKA